MAENPNTEEFKRKYEGELELWKREMYRKSLDKIKIYNPLDITFKYMYDSYWHSVPAKSYKVVERYLARHFFKDIADKMIGDTITLKGAALKKKREEQMGSQFTDHYQENLEVWERVPKMNDPELLKQIRSTVIIGLVEEYGAEEAEQEQRVAQAPQDFRPIHEQLMDEVMNKVSENEDAPVIAPESEPEVYVSKKDREKLAKEITNDET